jgi:hypothetical protein
MRDFRWSTETAVARNGRIPRLAQQAGFADFFLVQNLNSYESTVSSLSGIDLWCFPQTVLITDRPAAGSEDEQELLRGPLPQCELFPVWFSAPLPVSFPTCDFS